MKKIFIGIIIVIALIIVMGYFFVLRPLLKDQVTMQYDDEVISEYKRELNFEDYQLDLLDNYDEIHKVTSTGSIEDIQEALLNQVFTTVDLSRYYLIRIKDNQSYNAVIELNEHVLEEAALTDEKISKGQTGELFGTFVLLKDNIAAVGMHTSAGAYALKDVTTSRDACLTKALKEQGAIVLGKANLSEWSNYMSLSSSSGFSVLGGQTKHAYGKFDVGGSSSGSSVAAALNLSTFTIGTETSGSLIFPASQNSVVSLKPTLGLISRDLIIPIAEAQDSAGVITRSVADLEKIFHQILVIDSNDPMTEIIENYKGESILDPDYLKGKKLALVDNGSIELKAIVKDLENAGAIVTSINLESTNDIDMMPVLESGINYDLTAFLSNEAVQTDLNSLEDVVNFYKKNPKFAPYGINLLEGGLKAKHVEDTIIKNITIGRSVLDSALKGYDAIVSISNELSGVYAPAGYPALTVPSGYKESGEPYGVTFIGGYLEDHILIDIAYSYEQYTQYRKMPKED